MSKASFHSCQLSSSGGLIQYLPGFLLCSYFLQKISFPLGPGLALCLFMTCLLYSCSQCQANVLQSVGTWMIAGVSVPIHLFPGTKAASSDTLLVSLIILLAGDTEQWVRFFKGDWKHLLVQSDRSRQIRHFRIGAELFLQLFILLLSCDHCDSSDTLRSIPQ